MKKKEAEIILVDQIEPLILTIRGQKVVLDSDLATPYGTTTSALNQAVKRNQARFPPTFLFRLTDDEKQEVITNCDHLAKLKFSSKLPTAFTEHGAIMAASLINTPRAVEVSIFVVQAFVKLRQFALNHQDILRKLADLEKKVGANDEAIQQIVVALRHLMTPPKSNQPKGRIGFQPVYPDESKKKEQ